MSRMAGSAGLHSLVSLGRRPADSWLPSLSATCFNVNGYSPRCRGQTRRVPMSSSEVSLIVFAVLLCGAGLGAVIRKISSAPLLHALPALGP